MGDIRDNISNNITFYRKKLGYTQNQLAEKIGVKTTSVSSWERGANSPDIETLYAICKLFNISLDEMYGVNTENGYLVNDENSKTKAKEPEFDKVELLIARNGKKMSKDQKLRLIQLLSELDWLGEK